MNWSGIGGEERKESKSFGARTTEQTAKPSAEVGSPGKGAVLWDGGPA